VKGELTRQHVGAAMDELGIELDFQQLSKLVKQVKFSEPRSVADRLYLLAHEALHGPHGYAWEYAAGSTMLVARDGDRFVFGILWNTNAKRPFPPWKWKITRWSKDLAKNRDQVATWAKTETEHVVVGKLVRPPAREVEATGDGAALLAAVIANPEDGAARLVYADWLIERGDPRGELMRLHQEGKDEAHELERKHSAVILAPYAAFDAGTRVTGGFVEALVAYPGKLAKHPEIFEREPFRSLRLVAMKPDELAKLAQACGARLARITTLHLEGRKSPRHYATVRTQPSALAPVVPAVRTLRVERLDETLREWRAFLTGLRAPIEKLWIDAVPRAVFEILDERAVLPALRHITIGFQGWCDRRGRAQALAVARILATRGLASVKISSWHPGGATMAEIVDALLETKDLQITLDNCTMDADVRRALANRARVTIKR
jgi:uncharacterized protein (TIGR02996 family)